MKKIRHFTFVFLGVCFSVTLFAQEAAYQWPSDTLVQQKLKRWQDLKFGIIIHWGLYAVPGIVESWALCSEPWVQRDSSVSYDQFKEWYWGLSKEFNPTKFDPKQWADAAADAGMRYVVFTTKHHDGFCMFDTKETDFRISAGPFSSDPRADVARHVFDAFRKKNFMIGAYFSKPDWHSPYYWWPAYATPDRNNNYDPRKFPWRWNAFQNYTYRQLSELTHNYGSIDILWLDGGWVRPRETVNDEVRSWGGPIPEWSQDIDMPRIATMARTAQPGILIVDRTVHGMYENYRTPEQHIPKEPLDYPWETCMTLGNAWGHVANDELKSAASVIHSLIEIVAKGGSLLLGVGPRADGTIEPLTIERLSEVGQWLKRNGEAIYNTRPMPHFRENNVYFTHNPGSKLSYALVCLDEDQQMPSSIEWTGNLPLQGSPMVLLQTGLPVKWSLANGRVKVNVPKSARVPGLKYAALAFSFRQSE
jgi:alpha-L-fucosidase